VRLLIIGSPSLRYVECPFRSTRSRIHRPNPYSAGPAEEGFTKPTNYTAAELGASHRDRWPPMI
jgi:hypothetical protein